MSVAIDEVFSALAEPTRRKIIEALKIEPMAVGALVVQLEISQPTVSKHLKVLREADLVSMTAQGQRRIYSVQCEAIDTLVSWCVEFLPAEESAAELVPVDLDLIQDPQDANALPAAAHQLGRSVGRGLEQVTGRAQEILERIPRFGRRR
ncbi:ArsR/SmtB family transcription factor [Glutamicibacter sp. 287]|uniref:ArsR/SmtB family transcription factor n=1 Tax=unclassified Glutamicibacter TaxID=2627139 RepID=UPI004033185C